MSFKLTPVWVDLVSWVGKLCTEFLGWNFCGRGGGPSQGGGDTYSLSSSYMVIG